MKEYKAICGNSSMTITGCETAEEALDFAITQFDNNCDHTGSVAIYDMDGEYVAGEDD